MPRLAAACILPCCRPDPPAALAAGRVLPNPHHHCYEFAGRRPDPWIEWSDKVGDAQNVRVIIADDHPLFRTALRQAVAAAQPDADVAEAGSFEEMTAALGKGQVEADLVLLDLTMPGVQGFSGLLYLRADHPSLPVLVVSGNDDASIIRRCIEFGAAGFLPKRFGTREMGEAIRTVLDGGTWTPPDIDLSQPVDKETADIVRRLATLTPQQVRVLMMLSQGLLNKQIAYEIGVSEATVKAHVSAILEKLNVDSRTQAVIVAGKIASSGIAATLA